MDSEPKLALKEVRQSPQRAPAARRMSKTRSAPAAAWTESGFGV